MALKNWKNVEEIKFTFNVDRDTTHYERSWIWNIRKNEVTGISERRHCSSITVVR